MGTGYNSTKNIQGSNSLPIWLSQVFLAEWITASSLFTERSLTYFVYLEHHVEWSEESLCVLSGPRIVNTNKIQASGLSLILDFTLYHKSR